MRRINILLTVIISLTITSCSAIFIKSYGIKQPKERSIEDIERFAGKYGIPKESSFVLDSSYWDLVAQLDSSQWRLRKDHSQPLQILYFDGSGSLISFHNNCYTGGFPNLKWNRAEIFNSFTPESRIPLDSLLNLQRQLSYLQKMDGSAIDASEFEKANYTVVVYWSIFMGRQSKRMIKLVQENFALADGENNQLIFVNNDNVFEDASY